MCFLPEAARYVRRFLQYQGTCCLMAQTPGSTGPLNTTGINASDVAV
jgi:hypothetical protein